MSGWNERERSAWIWAGQPVCSVLQSATQRQRGKARVHSVAQGWLGLSRPAFGFRTPSSFTFRLWTQCLPLRLQFLGLWSCTEIYVTRSPASEIFRVGLSKILVLLDLRVPDNLSWDFSSSIAMWPNPHSKALVPTVHPSLQPPTTWLDFPGEPCRIQPVSHL